MKLPEKRISPFQLVMSVTCFIQGSVMLSAFLMRVTKQDSWFAVLVGYGITAALVAGYSKLMTAFPGKSIVEIFQTTFGNIVGGGFSLLLIFYFVTLAALNVRDISNFIVGFFLPETPLWAVLLLILAVSTYAVQCGMETIVRISTILVVASFALALFMLIFNFDVVDMSNFKPYFTLPIIQYVQSAHTLVTILMGEIFAFTMVIPMISDYTKVHSSMQKGLLLGGIFLFIIISRDIAVLGPVAEIVSVPSYEAIRLINIGNVITRPEILFTIVRLWVQFFKVTILFFASAIGISQIFGLGSVRPIILVLGSLIGAYSMFTFNSASENAQWGATTAAFFSSFFLIVLPAILAAGILVRGLMTRAKGRGT